MSAGGYSYKQNKVTEEGTPPIVALACVRVLYPETVLEALLISEHNRLLLLLGDTHRRSLD